MRYYTKEWYTLMQCQHYTSGLRKIPDKVYSKKEIQSFYDRALKEEVARERKIYETPPSYEWSYALLQPDKFTPDTFLFEDEETGERFHPQTPEAAKAYLDKQRQKMEEQFANRPPFNPTETMECFQQCYRMGLRHAGSGYPEWVRETVDKRLLALYLMPESAYKRLKQEEQKNRRAFHKIEKAAQKVLRKQNIPVEIRSAFRFHDANLLALKKVRSDLELYLRKDGGWSKDTTPYIKVIFKNVTMYDREKGLVLRTKIDSDGGIGSNCQCLYDELYRTDNGYEVHMLLWTAKALRYLTIGCEDICFEDNIQL